MSAWLARQMPSIKDVGYLFHDGRIVYSSLFDNPWYYIQLTFGPNNYFPEPEHLCKYIDAMGLWYDYTGYTLVRINAIFMLFSFGHFYVQSMLFGIMSFVGLYYLYRFFSALIPINEYSIIAILFCIPSILFWTTSIGKEATVVFALGLLLYFVYSLSLAFSIKSLLAFIFFFLLLLNVRVYMILVLLPALVAYYWNLKCSKIKAFVPYLICNLTVLGLAIIYDSVVPNQYRMMYMVTDIQSSFINNTGNTSFPIYPIENSWVNLFLQLPKYLLNGFIYPTYNLCSATWCRLASIESMLISGFLLLCLLKVKYRYFLDNSIALFCLSIGLTLMLFIDVVVNNAGALVRYRTIALIFIFIGILASFKEIRKTR